MGSRVLVQGYGGLSTSNQYPCSGCDSLGNLITIQPPFIWTSFSDLGRRSLSMGVVPPVVEGSRSAISFQPAASSVDNRLRISLA